MDLTVDEWNIVSKNFRGTTSDWDDLSIADKMPYLAFKSLPLFGHFNCSYPNDIYHITLKHKLNLTIDNSIIDKLNKEHEYAGEIINNGKKVVWVNEGGSHQTAIEPDPTESKQIVFHTHPYDGTNPVDPPSSMDIATFISTMVEYMYDVIYPSTKNGKNIQTDDLPFQSEITFAKDGAYVYYLSYPLLSAITNAISHITVDRDILAQRAKLVYSNYLIKQRPEVVTNDNVEYYLNAIRGTGVIINKFPYTNVEVYIK